MWKKAKWALALAVVPAVIGYFGCGVDQPSIPELSGPSELAVSLQMRAIPDQLTADGWSSAVIEVTYRDENGRTVAGRTINFDLGAQSTVGAAGGLFFDLGNLAPLNGLRPIAGGPEATAVSAVTDSSGVARVRYWAPFRTDQENDTIVTITARPAGTDFRSAIFRQVDIFLRAANRPSFPGGSTCDILVEPQDAVYAVGELIFFSATQIQGANGQPIARYEWEFGDATANRAEGRNVAYSFSQPGIFTVTLFTTESVTGDQTTCQVAIEVSTDGAGPAPEPVPEPDCLEPLPSFVVSGTCSTFGEILADDTAITQFNGSASRSGHTGTGAAATQTIERYIWDFGDGTPLVTTTGPVISHVYSSALAGRAVTITLVVVTNCGSSAATSSTHDVLGVCP